MSVHVFDNDKISPLELDTIALEIILGLQNDAVYSQNQIKWPNIISSPPSEWYGPWSEYYYGYWWGAAGIGDIFLRFYQEFGNQSFLSQAELAANFIQEGGTPYPGGGLYWNKTDESILQYYGMKYGNAGIAKFFLHLYEQTGNATHLAALNSALLPLEMEAHNDTVSQTTYWGIAINDTRDCTGVTYGTAGIAGVFLEAGSSLNNASWITLATRSGRWLENISRIDEVNDTMAISWSTQEPFNETLYTGLGSGNAGIGMFFLDLYRETGDIRWIEDAKRIGNWLLLNMINGSWTYGGVGYSTETDEGDIITGMDGGAAGIGTFLLYLYNETSELKYANGVIEAAKWLLNHAIAAEIGIKWPKAITGRDNGVFLTGYSYGAAGIGDFFRLAYEMFGCSRFEEAMLGAVKWLDSQRTQLDRFVAATGNIRFTNSLNQRGNHLSYYDGAAGITLFFVNAAKSFNSTAVHQSVVSCENLPPLPIFTPTDSSSQTTGTSHTEQSSLMEDLFLPFLGMLGISSIIAVIVVVTKKKVDI
ncbi:MAG: lanthionine synthetase LanC family protein [Candidatus Odinarchaeota archaeon]